MKSPILTLILSDWLPYQYNTQDMSVTLHTQLDILRYTFRT